MQTLISSKAVEDVELGQREAVDAGGADGLSHQGGVEPAAAALAAGDGSELAAALADEIADRVVLLGGKRPQADARGVGLGRYRAHSRPRPGPRPVPVAAAAATVFDEVT